MQVLVSSIQFENLAIVSILQSFEIHINIHLGQYQTKEMKNVEKNLETDQKYIEMPSVAHNKNII